MYIWFCKTQSTEDEWTYKYRAYRQKGNSHYYAQRLLYLNLLPEDKDKNEDDTSEFKYSFEFRRKDEANEAGSHWFKVRDIMSDQFKVDDYVNSHINEGQREKPKEILQRLYDVIHHESIDIVEYVDNTIDGALKVFARKNTAGQPLSPADLIVSYLSALWKGKEDPKQQLEETVGSINRFEKNGEENEPRFNFDRNFVLRACFMLKSDEASDKISLSLDNINDTTVKNIEENWKAINKALECSVNLLEEFGFGYKKLTSRLPVLPIAYYFKKTNKDVNDLSAEDKQAIQRYLYLVLFKRLFRGRNPDTILGGLKDIIIQDSAHGFPLGEIQEKYNLKADANYIKDLLERVRYGERAHDEMPNCTQVLYLISPDKELYKKGDLAVDHIFPRNDYDDQDFCHQLPNLQILTKEDNSSKSDKIVQEWYDSHGNKERLIKESFFPEDAAASLKVHTRFINARKERIIARLEELLLNPIS